MYSRCQPSCATSVKHIQCEVTSSVGRRVCEIYTAISINVQVIEEVQRTTVYDNLGRKETKGVTCIKCTLLEIQLLATLVYSSDVNKNWTHKDQDKDKDQSHKDKDKD